MYLAIMYQIFFKKLIISYLLLSKISSEAILLILQLKQAQYLQ